MKNLMKTGTNSVAILAVVLFATTLALAAPKAPKTNAPQSIPAFPGTLVNARFIFVTSYDGDQFDPNLLSEDRQAIATVQDAMQKWGKFILVYEPPVRRCAGGLRCPRLAAESIPLAHDGPQWSAAK